ncbi:MAG: acyl carrier protein [Oscillospiraceae bacterium]|nr:acyl carrier protein [Oscillospiraceae bacterium]
MTHEEIFATLKSLIADQFGISESEVTMATSYEDTLGADSVDLVELSMSMEDAFGLEEFDEEEVAGLKTVGDTVNFLVSKLNA